MSLANKVVDTFPFVKVSDTSKLIPILEKRLPKSAIIYNSAKMHLRNPQNNTFYTLNGEIDDSCWIIFSHFRKDYGQDYLISAVEENSKITKEEATKIFSESKLFDWDKAYFFISLEKWISAILIDVSVNHKGNDTEVHPCKLYYMDIEESLGLDIRSEDPSVEIKRLDLAQGVDFIVNTWKYAIENTRIEMENVIEKNESGGVYVDGKPVCGVITQGFGLLSALYTYKEHRQKGYAKLCMKFAFKELAKSRMVPCLTVELKNQPSLTFHDKLGCKVACTVDFLFYTCSGF